MNPVRIEKILRLFKLNASIHVQTHIQEELKLRQPRYEKPCVPAKLYRTWFNQPFGGQGVMEPDSVADQFRYKAYAYLEVVEWMRTLYEHTLDRQVSDIYRHLECVLRDTSSQLFELATDLEQNDESAARIRADALAESPYVTTAIHAELRRNRSATWIPGQAEPAQGMLAKA